MAQEPGADGLEVGLARLKLQRHGAQVAETPLERKRALFDQMTKAWGRVPIPLRILEPHSLHAAEQIRERPRP